MRLVVGLGNPGPEYDGTRHNVGFEVVERLAHAAQVRVNRLDCQALTGRGRLGEEAVLLAKPVTYMNASGEAVFGLLKKTGIELSELLVISDEIDLPVGALRLKPGGSSGGQKGLRSIETCLQSQEFSRLRVGIRGSHYSRQEELSDYVLDRFSKEERPVIEETLDRAAEAARLWATAGIEAAMNRYNAIPE